VGGLWGVRAHCLRVHVRHGSVKSLRKFMEGKKPVPYQIAKTEYSAYSIEHRGGVLDGIKLNGAEPN